MRADELADALAPHVAAGAVPGAVVGVDHGGTVGVAALGTTAPGGDDALRPDALVRVSSNTKPLVAALTLALVEDGTLALDEPVERHVPELADRRVLVRLEDTPGRAETVPASRPMTLDDLLTMRMGFGWVWDRACPTVDEANQAGILGPPDPAGLPASDEWIARLARFPLLHQPGAAWRYDAAFGVLGVVLARATGRPLPDLLAERVLTPLAMADTGFRAVDPGRLVPAWRHHRDTERGAGPSEQEEGPALLDEGGAASAWARDPAFPDARGGLVSSATDLLRFARALLDGGSPVLPPQAVAAMTRDWLTEAQRADATAQPFLDGGGWGLGLGVHAATPAGPRYGWAGGLGTLWWSWPEHDAAAVLVTQVSPPVGPVFDAFRRATQDALTRG